MASTDAERMRAVLAPLVEADDVHTTIYWNQQMYGHYHPADESMRAKFREIMETPEARDGKAFAKIGPSRAAYVFVPAMSSSSSDEALRLAAELRRSIIEVERAKPTGWVIDLRANGGGNLVPMLLGLQPLLGRGVVAGYMDAEGKIEGEWELTDAGLSWNTDQVSTLVAEMPAHLSASSSAPVVVLIGMATRSSGQALAVAFSGRPNTTLVGETTARGYTTVNYPFDLGGGTIVNLAVGFITDRKRRAYRTVVEPDERLSLAIGEKTLMESAHGEPVLAILRSLGGRKPHAIENERTLANR